MTTQVFWFLKKLIAVLFGMTLILFGLSVFKFRLLNEFLWQAFGIQIMVGKINLFSVYLLLFVAFLFIIFEMRRMKKSQKSAYEYFVPFVLVFIISVFIYFLLAFVYMLVYSVELNRDIDPNVGIFQFLSLFFGLHFFLKPFGAFEKFSASLIEHPRSIRSFYSLKGFRKKK